MPSLYCEEKICISTLLKYGGGGNRLSTMISVCSKNCIKKKIKDCDTFCILLHFCLFFVETMNIVKYLAGRKLPRNIVLRTTSFRALS